MNNKNDRKETLETFTLTTCLYRLNFCICLNANEPIYEYSFLEIKNAANSYDLVHIDINGRTPFVSI